MLRNDDEQDRHATSCYLALYAPEKQIIYRYSETEAFAQKIQLGKDFGAGENAPCVFDKVDIKVGDTVLVPTENGNVPAVVLSVEITDVTQIGE